MKKIDPAERRRRKQAADAKNYAANRELRLSKMAEYYAANREKLKQRAADYLAANREKVAQLTQFHNRTSYCRESSYLPGGR